MVGVHKLVVARAESAGQSDKRGLQVSHSLIALPTIGQNAPATLHSPAPLLFAVLIDFDMQGIGFSFHGFGGFMTDRNSSKLCTV